MNLNLFGKKALISGASRGIGFSIARSLALEGVNLAICARDSSVLRDSANKLSSFDIKVMHQECDVCDSSQVESFVSAAAVELGGIDIVINNVGGSAGGTLKNSTDSDWETTFDLNVFHAVRLTRAALPHLRSKGGGAVVIISSISGTKSAPRAQYGCAKAAENFLAGALALELAESNVRVNAVAPGFIDSPMARDVGDNVMQKILETIPIGRLGSPEEIAGWVSMLASESGEYVTGQVVVVDGGLSM